MTAPVLHTARLTLGPLGALHVAPFAAFYASDRSHHVGGPKSAEDAWRQLACEIGHWTLRGYGPFAITETATGRALGIVGPWFPEGWPEPELMWSLFAGAEGQGFATEAALAARDWAYATLGWTTAISLVAADNPGSAAVARRLGCVPDGDFTHARFGTVGVWRHPAPQPERV